MYIYIYVSPPFLVSESHTTTHTHTPGRIPPSEGSARLKGYCLQNTQQTQDTKVLSLGLIRTRNPRNPAAAT